MSKTLSAANKNSSGSEMNHDYRVLPAAEDDIFEIWRFIAEDNFDAAERVEAEIRGSFPELVGLGIPSVRFT